ncbi:cytochrome P460 family protein [Gemmatimonadota bacterium]
MKHLSVVLGGFYLVILLLIACASKPAPDAKPIPAVTPEDIWNYISEDQPYQDWSTFPPERIPAEAVWKDDYINGWIEGLVFKIYVNSTALSAIDKVPRNLPYGSIIIADVYKIKEDETLGEFMGMGGFYKVEGSTARYNDWVSFSYAPDGSVMDADSGPVFGTETHCYSCHEAAENDYIWIDSPKYDVEHTQMPSPEKQ